MFRNPTVFERLRKVTVNLYRGLRYDPFSKAASFCLVFASFLFVVYILFQILSTFIGVISQIFKLLVTFVLVSISSFVVSKVVDDRRFKKDLSEFFECVKILLKQLFKALVAASSVFL